MKELTAKNAKQLGICLNLLHAEHEEFTVMIRESDKRKIYYAVGVEAEGERMLELEEKYRVLIS